MREKILITGGTGYIGSHTVVELLNDNYDVVILDNLTNSDQKVIERINDITQQNVSFVEGDIRDRDKVRNLLNKHNFQSIIHFAGLKSIAEANDYPLEYYDNNVTGSITLFQEAINFGIKKLVFSSTCAVYAETANTKCDENSALNPTNAYSRTKLIVENFLHDIKNSNQSLRIAILRYFNAAGAHISGKLGENPTGSANNLIPIIAKVAMGKRNSLDIYGNDYPTKDGTCLRDYIHVQDLAKGHLAALKYLNEENSILTINLGSGDSHSVLEIIAIFEDIAGKKIPYKVVKRRKGDCAQIYSDTSLARNILEWTSKNDLRRICIDSWAWYKNNIDQ